MMDTVQAWMMDRKKGKAWDGRVPVMHALAGYPSARVDVQCYRVPQAAHS